jgi:hypothetical protein
MPKVIYNFCPRPGAILPPDFGGRRLEKLKTSTRQVESVTIVALSGRITQGEANFVVRDVITMGQESYRASAEVCFTAYIGH